MKKQKSLYQKIGICFVLLGMLCAAGAFIVDYIGMSNPEFLGIQQIYLLAIGIGLTLTGLTLSLNHLQLKTLVQKNKDWYVTISIIIFNTIIFIVLIEGFFFMKELNSYMHFGADKDPIKNISRNVFNPSDAGGPGMYKYYPFALYRHAPFKNERTTIDERGIRMTPGARCTEPSYKIFVFGGSTVYGFPVGDTETLTAYLQESLSKIINKDVCVQNYAANGWVSTQSTIMLMMELQKNHIPDLVIFYDGINDSFYAKTYHMHRERFDQAFEEMENSRHAFLYWIRSLNIYKFFQNMVKNNKSINKESVFLTEKDWARAAVLRYLNNVKIVEAISNKYDFKTIFFWQPTSKKYKTNVRSETYDEIYRLVKEETETLSQVVWFGDILDDHEDLYIGDGLHLKPEGNKFIAQEIIAVLLSKKLLPLDSSYSLKKGFSKSK